eukprot:TRINITY_DN15452_c0_g2_i1.p1 TRINITY_DN15452_c0_g2~~TRINITY_DN15452_c0_g2_i1.p1  ORF type:complete len:662 (+),score=157.72 TRINITY_DN15452_c0_g2_i1:924-2909(+)
MRRFSIQNRPRTANAYMLVYVRKSVAQDLLKPLEEGEVPDFLIEKFKLEQEEKIRRRKEQEEEAKKMDIYLLDERSLLGYGGLELGDLDQSKLIHRRIFKENTLEELRESIEKDLGLEENSAQFFAMYDRQNSTNRPNKVCDTTVPLSVEFSSRRSGPIFVRQRTEEDPSLTDHSLLLMFKYFNPLKKTLEYVGSRVFESSTPCSNVFEYLIEFMKFPPGTDLLLFEEENASDRRINALADSETTLEQFKLMCGDIICFQKAPVEFRKKRSLVGQDYSDSSSTDVEDESPVSSKAMKVNDFLEDLYDRVSIKFCPIDSDLEGVDDLQWDDEVKGRFTLDLRRSFSYTRVVRELARRLGDPAIADRIQLSPFNRFAPNARARFSLDGNLNAVLQQRITEKKLAMYYETLQYPLKVLEQYMEIPIEWFDSPAREPYTINVLVKKENSRVGDVLNAVMRYKLSADDAEQFRLALVGDLPSYPYGVGHQQHIRRIVRRRPVRLLAILENKTVEALDAFLPFERVWSSRYRLTLRAEITPNHELPGSQEFIAWVVFFSVDYRQNHHFHGHPFSIPVSYRMTTRDVKERIVQMMGAPIEKVDKWKFCFMTNSDHLALDDSMSLDNCLEQFASYHTSNIGYIGVDQGSDAPKRRSSIHDTDRSIKIYS